MTVDNIWQSIPY